MDVSLGGYFEELVAALIAGGRYQNQSEVIRAGLRLLEKCEYPYDSELENQLVKRLESPSSEWTKGDLGEIRKFARAKLKRARLNNAS